MSGFVLMPISFCPVSSQQLAVGNQQSDSCGGRIAFENKQARLRRAGNNKQNNKSINQYSGSLRYSK